MKIKAKAGIMLRDPVSKHVVPAEGLVVSDNDFFWARRVRDGDAIIVKDDKKSEANS